jgi:hypothetical protein
MGAAPRSGALGRKREQVMKAKTRDTMKAKMIWRKIVD